MNLFESDYYLHYFAFDAWRTAYEYRQSLASSLNGLQDIGAAFENVTETMNRLADLLSDIDWSEVEDDEDPAGRIDW